MVKSMGGSVVLSWMWADMYIFRKFYHGTMHMAIMYTGSRITTQYIQIELTLQSNKMQANTQGTAGFTGAFTPNHCSSPRRQSPLP